MTSNQRAAVKGVAAAGILIAALGIVLLVFDLSTVDQICKPYYAGSRDEYCVQEDVSLRGVFALALGIVLAAGAFVASRVQRRSAGQQA